MGPARARTDRWATAALVGAALWSLGLLAWAFFVPSYAGGSTGSTTGATTGPVISHLTIVQENGLGVAAILSIPLVATAIVAVALRRRRRSESRGPGPVAVGLTAAVGVFGLLGALTVGPVVMPVCVLLVIACARASGGVADLAAEPGAWSGDHVRTRH